VSDLEFPELRAAAGRSRMLRAAAVAVNRMTGARGSSVTAQWLTDAAVAWNTLPARQQFRLCAMTFAWAAMLYWAALFVMPPYTATGLPRAMFLATAMVAFLAAGNATAIVSAWPTSRLASALRWLVS